MDPFVKSGELKQMGKSGGYSCLLAGNALMARKDSAFISIWNQGYSRMRANGDFQKLCQEAKTKHGKTESKCEFHAELVFYLQYV